MLWKVLKFFAIVILRLVSVIYIIAIVAMWSQAPQTPFLIGIVPLLLGLGAYVGLASYQSIAWNEIKTHVEEPKEKPKDVKKTYPKNKKMVKRSG